MGEENIGRLGSMIWGNKFEYDARMKLEDPPSSERTKLFRLPPQ